MNEKLINKVKHVGIIYLLFFIVITNFSVVFADDELIDESLDLQQNENDVVTNDESIDYPNYDEQINDLQSQINSLDDDLNNDIRPRLMSVGNSFVNGDNGMAINFSAVHYGNYATKLLEIYDYYDIIRVKYNDNNGGSYKTINIEMFNANDLVDFTFDDSIGQYSINFSKYYTTGGYGGTSVPSVSTKNQSINILFNIDTVTTTRDEYSFLKFYFDNRDYHLRPYQINVVNDNSDITFTKTKGTPNQNIYYENQPLTFTITDTNNNYYGIQDIDTNQFITRDKTYIFNITKNMNIRIVSKDQAVEQDKTLLNDYVAIIMVLLMFMLFKQLIWGV